MKNFPAPMVTISPEEYAQLQKCKSIVETLWWKFGPYSWPEVFRLPRGKTIKDIINDEHEMAFYAIRTDIGTLMEFDDSE